MLARIVCLSLLFSFFQSSQTLGGDKKEFQFDDGLEIVFTNSSLLLDSNINDQMRGKNIKKVFIDSSTNPNEAKEIVRCIYRNAEFFGPSLKEIKVLRDSTDHSVDHAILPLLRELITHTNGFVALEDPWWNPSYKEQLINWTCRFLHLYSSSDNERNNHVKAH